MIRAAWLERLGRPGIAGLGLLFFCLAYYFGNIAPARDTLDSLAREAAQLAARLPAGAATTEPAAEGGQLPPFATVTDSLKILDDLAARHGVALERATYQLNERDGERQLEVSLPLKAGYLPLRAWLRDVLALPESPTLDEIVLRRQQTTDATLDADVRLTFRFAPP